MGPVGPVVSEQEPVLARQLDVRGISDPQFIDPGEADLAPTDPVIGLIVHGTPQAYSTRAMSGLARNHVVSQQTASGRITVTHCDLTNCTRVFVEAPDDKRAEVRVGGLRQDRSLELLIDGKRYLQRDQKIPLAEYPFAETSWEKWLAEHPQTKVYVGAKNG